jgi:hypothetical protein
MMSSQCLSSGASQNNGFISLFPDAVSPPFADGEAVAEFVFDQGKLFFVNAALLAMAQANSTWIYLVYRKLGRNGFLRRAAHTKTAAS